MTELEHAIAQPASLVARRALAAAWEAAGDPRAELIRVQLVFWEETARGGRASPRAQQARARADEPVRAHGRAWAGRIAALVERYRYHRGLVAEIKLSGDRLVELADELFALAPIQHLTLTAPIARWRELCALPRLAQIVSLEVAGVRAFGDAEAMALASARHAAGLRWLGLSGCAIGQPGVEALAASPYLDQLTYLGLRDNPFDPSPQIWNDGGVITVEPHPGAAGLERAYGRRRWLTPTMDEAADWPPDPDALAAH